MPAYMGVNRVFHTIFVRGLPLPDKMGAEERITKKRLGNPDLWKQLDAITNDRWVNHLGRGHERDSPSKTEIDWERTRAARVNKCQACMYGNTAVYLHTCSNERNSA